MHKLRNLRWKIDAFTPETMPLDRLADYMSELATMLGDAEHLHLITVEKSSTVPVLAVDNVAFERVSDRASAVRRGHAPASALASYRKINSMLRQDKATAVLLYNNAEIIPFPGTEEIASAAGITQRGSLDGELIKVGGAKEWVPIQLRKSDDSKVTGCYVKKGLAKRLGQHLFEPIRLFGNGRWNRTSDGHWILDRFWVDTFDQLSDESLPDVLANLRSIKADWNANPVADILSEE